MSEIVIVAALGLIAIAAVAYPFIAGHARYDDPEALEGDLERYREAVESDTVCPRCRLANRSGSRYCGECGRRLKAG